MASENSSVEKIPKLNDTNYRTWIKDMQAVLTIKGVADALDMDCPPGPVTDKHVKEWTRCQRIGLALIHLSCEPDQQRQIAECHSMTAAWESLQDIYNSTSENNVMRLEDAFATAAMKPDESAANYTARVRAAASELKAVGTEITPSRIAHRMLKGLPRPYAPLVTALLATGAALEVESVVKAILEEEHEIGKWNAGSTVNATNVRIGGTSIHHGPANTAMHATSQHTSHALSTVVVNDCKNTCTGPCCQPQIQHCQCHTCKNLSKAGPIRHQPNNHQYSREPYQRDSLSCHHCGKLGHTSNRCWNRFPALRPTIGRNTAEDVVTGANRTTQSSSNTNTNPRTQTRTTTLNFTDAPTETQGFIPPPLQKDPSVFENCFVTLTDFASNLSSQWLIDTGASHHYTSQKDLFISLTPTCPVGIKTGAGVVYARHKGVVPLILILQGNRVPILLEDVLYCPDLQAGVNLFSCDKLTEKGFKVEFDHSVVRMVKDGILMAQGTKMGSSWYLDVESERTAGINAFLTSTITDKEAVYKIWHARLGHASKKRIDRLRKIVLGMDVTKLDDGGCSDCHVGKQKKKISRAPITRAQHPLERIHVDICGPMKEKGYLCGCSYFCLFTCEKTRFRAGYPLVNKSDIREAFKAYKAWAENLLERKIKYLHSDNEPSMAEKEFQIYLMTVGITWETTAAYTPEMNPISERGLGLLVMMASTMMSAAGIPIGFWPEAIRTGCYLLNRSPHPVEKDTTPYEKWYSRVPDLSNLRIFGCRCYVHIPEQLRQKFDSRTFEGVFFGYYDTSNLYAVFDVHGRTLQKKRDVIFNEKLLGHPLLSPYGLPHGWDIMGSRIEDSVDVSDDDSDEFCTYKPTDTPVTSSVLQSQHNEHTDTLTPTPVTQTASDTPNISRSASVVPGNDFNSMPAKRVPRNTPAQHPIIPVQKKNDTPVSFNPRIENLINLALMASTVDDESTPSDNFSEGEEIDVVDMMESLASDEEVKSSVMEMEGFYREKFVSVAREFNIQYPLELDFSQATDVQDSQLPQSFKAAMRSSNKSFWLHACISEIESVLQKRTFDWKPTKDIPAGLRPLPTKWVFAVKRDVDGRIKQFKARWVARGDLQKKGRDYKETFAPVGKFATERILLIEAAEKDWEVEQIDVVSAFLNGEIDTMVFLRQPDGFSIRPLGMDTVCFLNKSLYGLCQAARVWHLALDAAIKVNGFVRLQMDPAAWRKDNCFIVAHVDDMLIAGPLDVVSAVKMHLSNCFKIKDLGAANLFIGLRITRDREKRELYLDQSHFAKGMLETHGLQDCNPVDIPMNPRKKFRKNPDSTPASKEDTLRYQRMIGSLLYLMNGTRPDLSYSTTKLAQYASNPSQDHIAALKQVYRYVKGTLDTKLILRGPVPEKNMDVLTDSLTGIFDAAWLDEHEEGKSTFGYVVFYKKAPISWKTKKHNMVVMSTTEAEYVAGTELMRECSWLANLLDDLHLPCEKPIPLFGDNKGANKMASNEASNHRSKHLAMRDFYITQKVSEGFATVTHLSTKDMTADTLTKALPKEAFKRHFIHLGLLLRTKQNDCWFCGKSFNSGNALHKHIELIHKSDDVMMTDVTERVTEVME